MNERIYIIGKSKDHLLQFWKLNKLEYDEEYVLKVINFAANKKFKIKPSNYSGVAELTLWTRDEHLDLFTNMYNIDGDQIPKPLSEVTLYPMANIKSEEDLERYNNWRMTEFKNIIRYLQTNFKWIDQLNNPISRIYRGWLNINVDADILPLKPIEVTFSQETFDKLTCKVALSDLY